MGFLSQAQRYLEEKKKKVVSSFQNVKQAVTPTLQKAYQSISNTFKPKLAPVQRQSKPTFQPKPVMQSTPAQRPIIQGVPKPASVFNPPQPTRTVKPLFTSPTLNTSYKPLYSPEPKPSLFGKVASTFKQGIENVKKTPWTEFNPLTSIFTKGPSQAREALKMTGNLIKRIPDMPEIEKGKEVGNKFIQSLIDAQRDKLNLGTKITNKVITPVIRDYGETSRKIGEQEKLNAWDAFNIYDVATPAIPEGAIAKSGMLAIGSLFGKKTGKKLLKESGEKLFKKGAKEVAETLLEKEAQKTGKEVLFNKSVKGITETPEEVARKTFNENWQKKYGNRSEKVATETALDKSNAVRNLANERSAYIQSKAGEPKSYSTEDIATYNKKAISAGKEFDNLSAQSKGVEVPAKTIGRITPSELAEAEKRLVQSEKNTDVLFNKGSVDEVAEIGSKESNILFEKGIQKSEIPNIPPKTPKGPTRSILDGLDEDFKTAREIRKTEKKVGFFDKIKSDWLDRFAPAEKVDKNLYMNLRLLSGGGSARATQIVKEGMGPILEKEAHRLDDFSKFLALQRLGELSGVKSGSAELFGRGIKRHLTPEEIGQGVIELEQKIGRPAVLEMRQSAEELRKFLDNTLEMLVESGIISKEAAQSARAKNQFYITFETIGQMIREAGEEGAGFAKNSFNMAQQNVFKGIGESTTGIADPLESTLQKAIRSIETADKNSVLLDFVRNNPDQIKIVREGSTASEGKAIINMFDNGNKISVEVDEMLASAVKNLQSEPFNWAIKVASIPTHILKAGAVTYNPAFFVVNPARDISDALIAEGAQVGLGDSVKILGEYTSALISTSKTDSAWANWVKAGGSQSTFLSSEIAKAPEITISSLAKIRSKNPLDIVKKIFDKLSKTTEETTRLAKFNKDIGEVGEDTFKTVKRNFATSQTDDLAKTNMLSKNNELSQFTNRESITPFAQLPENLRKASFDSRNITLDFARMGNLGRLVNQLIPFFNVGIQGSAKVIGLIRNNPIGFGKSMAVYAGIPSTLLYLHNRSLEDWQDVSDYEKENNIIIMLRDRTEEEKLEQEKIGKPEINAITIPKGNISKPFLNLWENFLSYMDNNERDTFMDLIAKQLQEVSPIGFPFGEGGTNKTLSKITPQIIKAPIESVTNKNLFTGRDIVPYSLEGVAPEEQYYEDTSPLAKALGKILGMSPLKIENFLSTSGGSVGKALLDPRKIKDITYGRFFGVRGGQKQADLFGKLKEEDIVSKTNSLQEKRSAEQLVKTINEMESQGKTDQEMDNFWNSQTDDVKRKAKDIMTKENSGLSDFELKLKGSSVETRANTIKKMIDDMETKGSSDEEVDALWNKYVESKVITKDVQKVYKSIISNKQTVIPKVNPVAQAIKKVNPFNPPSAGASDLVPEGVKGKVGNIIDKVAEETRPGDLEFKKVLHAIALAESGGDPGAEGDGGWSIGLFQNHRRDGRGRGYSVEWLKNPENNTRLSVKELVIYYDRGVKQGLTGNDLVAYVSKYGQRPAPGNENQAASKYGQFVTEGGNNIVYSYEDTTPQPSREEELRTANIALALGIQPNQYRKGLQQDQNDIDKAFRSNDPYTIQLMREEGFKPSSELNAPVEEVKPAAVLPPEKEKEAVGILQTIKNLLSALKERYS